MKYAIILPDGAADFPLPQLGGRTPLEAARIPHMDAVAAGRADNWAARSRSPRASPPAPTSARSR